MSSSTALRNQNRKASEAYFQTKLHRSADEGPMRPAYYATCSECGTEEFIHSSGNKALPFAVTQRKFEQKGWLIAKSREHDICPACLAKKRAAQKAEKETAMAAEVKPVEPRQMSRDDRRVLFAKLEDVYVGDGYIDGWTDKRVAEDLNVPRAWVEEVRSEFFGDVAVNPDIIDFLDKYDAIYEEVTKLRSQVMDVGNKVDELIKLGRRIKETI